MAKKTGKGPDPRVMKIREQLKDKWIAALLDLKALSDPKDIGEGRWLCQVDSAGWKAELNVSIEHGGWYCPSTGEKGDVISLLKRATGKPFPKIVDDLERCAGIPASTSIVTASAGTGGSISPTHTRYAATVDGFLILPTLSSDTPRLISSFTAEIITNILYDDGFEQQRVFEIEGIVNGETLRGMVTPADFYAMKWVPTILGPLARILPLGYQPEQLVRDAIQSLSRRIVNKTVYRRMGWVNIGGESVYLHGGGAIGQVGWSGFPASIGVVSSSPTSTVPTSSPAAASCAGSGRVGRVTTWDTDFPISIVHYALPDPPTGDDLKKAAKIFLNFAAKSNRQDVVITLMALALRAPLGPIDFMVFLWGKSGTFKTALAAIVQQFWGRELHAANLPTGWGSTANAIRELLARVNDAVVVIDDYIPEGSEYDRQRTEGKAADVIRSVGNRAGRQRARSDGSLQPRRDPKAATLATGEELPRGQSILARILGLELRSGDVDPDILLSFQKHAREGVYAQVMAAYIQWLAPRIEDIQLNLKSEVEHLRATRFCIKGMHGRVPTILAELGYAVMVFYNFLVDSGVVTTDERDLDQYLWHEWLEFAAKNHTTEIAEADPVKRFFSLLRSALLSGQCHLRNSRGFIPGDGNPGWVKLSQRTGETEDVIHARGDCIGWLDHGHLYLEPEVAYRVARKAAGSESEGVAVSLNVLKRRLRDAGALAATSKTRGTLTIRKMFSGRRVEVLHIRRRELLLFPKSDYVSPSWAVGV